MTHSPIESICARARMPSSSKCVMMRHATWKVAAVLGKLPWQQPGNCQARKVRLRAAAAKRNARRFSPRPAAIRFSVPLDFGHRGVDYDGFERLCGGENLNSGQSLIVDNCSLAALVTVAGGPFRSAFRPIVGQIALQCSSGHVQRRGGLALRHASVDQRFRLLATSFHCEP
jgi:hypothetical protein